MVFIAGTIFGSVRRLVLLPLLGERYATLTEMPLMLLATWQSAQFTLWQSHIRHGRAIDSVLPICIGILGLIWLALIESGITAMHKRGGWTAVKAYFLDRDVVAGSAYGLALLAYTLMPWYIWTTQSREDETLTWQLDVVDCAEDEWCDR